MVAHGWGGLAYKEEQMKRSLMPGAGALLVMVLFAAALVGAAAATDPIPDEPDVDPILSTEQNPDCVCGDCSYKIDSDPGPEDGQLVYGETTTYNADCGDAVITTTIDDSGVYLDWTSTNPVCTVIMKGGAAGANLYVYDYPPGTYFDEQLHPPLNPSGEYAQISHITFCYGEAPPTYCISGYKYDGCTDLGLAGWTITLYDANDVQVGDPVVTDANGYYEFCDLLPGEYTVTETLQDGWYAVDDITSIDVTLPDDANAEFEAAGNNFYNAELLCISGYKYDGCTDLGLEGWTITLYDENDAPVGDPVVTDANGYYEFCDLLPGTYTVTETLQDGWYAVDDITSIPVTLVECADAENQNFYNAELLCISGYKYDGCSDPAVGLEGWTITLYDENDVQVGDPVVTDANGYYEFCDLLPGTYTVTETLQDGWYAVDDITSIPVTLVECADAENQNFYNAEFSCISGYKSFSGDVGDASIEGWTITLYDANGVQVGDPVVTDANGYYEFCDLLPGTYTVEETLPDLTWVCIPPITVVLNCGEDAENQNFVNEKCGGDGHTPGFWQNRNGQALIGEDDLAMLRDLCLVNADGSAFDPTTKQQVKDWILADASDNMAYKLSAMLAAMALNVHNGFVDSTDMIYVPYLDLAGDDDIASVAEVMAWANTALCEDPLTPVGDPNRYLQELLKNALDGANNNENWACGCSIDE
jgi:hypothetical protein